MSSLNFTLQDVIGTFAGVALFPLVIVLPGYVFGWLFDLFEFRARLLYPRLAISLLLSIAISPILYYLTASLFSMNIALIVTGLFAIVFVILLIYEKPVRPKDRQWRSFFWVALGWTALAIFCLVDLQWGQRELYFSVASFDQTTRVSIIDAMTRTGVPPINPSYYPGHYVKLTFLYFFWYILGSLVDIAGGNLVDARAALFASIVWCGLALMALIAFYIRLRDVHAGGNGSNPWRRAMIGIASISITGLDLLPSIILMGFGKGVLGDIEHWNEQITAWIGSLLWVPHHVASLVAGVVAVMLVHSARGQSPLKKIIALVFSGVAFASAIGLSVWVTLIFVIFWGVWMLFIYSQKEQRDLLFPMALAGLVALLLSGKFLAGLLSGGAGGESAAFPIAFTIRSFRFTDIIFEYSSWKFPARLIFLPLNYFLELGFFAAAAFIWLKIFKHDLRKNPYYFAELLLLTISFFIGTFTRSTMIANNDLGWRAWLPGQFILLIWGVDILENLFTSRPRFILAQRTKYNLLLLAALGISTSLLDVALLRSAYYFSFGSEAGRRIYSARQVYTLINQSFPTDIIVQYNPSAIINRPAGLYGMRQSAISDRTAYGVPLNDYYDKVAAVGKLFNMQDVQNWGPLDALCNAHSIDVIVIMSDDPLWESLFLLERQRSALYADDYYAAFVCGKNTTALPAPISDLHQTAPLN